MPEKYKISDFLRVGKQPFKPYFERENDFKRIVIIHTLGALLIAPVFSYAMYRAGAPDVYIYSGLAYAAFFPIYVLICWLLPFLRDRLIYILIFHLFVTTIFNFYSLSESRFSQEEFFYFFAFYAMTGIIIQRLYPAILYHFFVILLLLNSHESIEESELSPFVVVGVFLVFGILMSFIIYVRRKLISTMEDYTDYLKAIMNNPGSGYILFDISKTPVLVDYNNEAIRVLQTDNSTIESRFFGSLKPDDMKKITQLKMGHRYVKTISFSKVNTRYYVEFKIVVLQLKNSIYWLANINNVTDDILKREELELKEKRYRNLYFRNKAGVFTLNKQSKIIDGNDSFFKMFEGTLKKGDRLFGLENEQDWDLIMESLQSSGKAQSYQTQYALLSGVKKTFIFSWYVDEQTGYIEGSVIDLTNIEKASQALKQSEEKYRLIYEESNDAILLLDDDHIVDVNRKAEEQFGKKRIELINVNLFDLSTDRSVKNEKNYQAQKSKLSKSRNIRFNWLFKGVNGTIEAEVSLIEITIGSKLYYQCVIHDQTEQNKLAKEQLRAEVAEETNIKLEEEIKERINAEVRLQEQFLRTRAIFESSSNTLMLTLSLDGNISTFNSHCHNYFRNIFGITIEQEIVFADVLKEVVSVPRLRMFKILLEKIKKGASRQYEVKLTLDKKEYWVEIFMNPIFDTEGKVVEISLVGHDISEKKKSSIEIEESLKEKEVLLKEIHHRVKNNLQVISSILNLQSSFVSDENTLGILQESRNRIRSMAIIHENLYRTEDFSSIKFSNYLNNLTSNLVASYSVNRKIQVNADMDDIDLILDQAIPCGLLINEVITNSLKYAWEEGMNGEITIQLKEENGIVHLEIRDNGAGLPLPFEDIKSDTLGLQLILTLAEQLEAELKVDVKGGTKYLIKFENTKPDSNVQN